MIKVKGSKGKTLGLFIYTNILPFKSVFHVKQNFYTFLHLIF